MDTMSVKIATLLPHLLFSRKKKKKEACHVIFTLGKTVIMLLLRSRES